MITTETGQPVTVTRDRDTIIITTGEADHTRRLYLHPHDAQLLAETLLAAIKDA